jgi:hypothetical protein
VTEAVTDLCEGVITAAERLVYSSRQAASLRVTWPGLNVDSLREAAAVGVSTSHSCAILLHTLADANPATGSDSFSAATKNAAQAHEAARDNWLRVARALDGIGTHIRGYITPDTTDARDLSLWTGRLAYANPEWTPASGPRQPARPSTDLLSSPDRLTAVIAAVHHGGDALKYLVATHEQQVLLATSHGQLHVATRSLPEDYHYPRRLGPAPPVIASMILTTYEETRTAVAEAAAATGEVAVAIQAPSRVLSHTALAKPDQPDRNLDTRVSPSAAAVYGVVQAQGADRADVA